MGNGLLRMRRSIWSRHELCRTMLGNNQGEAVTDIVDDDVMTPAIRRRWFPAVIGLVIMLALPAAVLWRASAGPVVPAPAPQNIGTPPTAVDPPLRPAPAVQPVKLMPITPETALEMNKEVPFSKLPNPAARPLNLKGTTTDLTRATDCLAAAQWYEAGDDPEGQRAVAQVVLNRLRHPAFPKTICGVVFQGSERATGCQFTFTCDGALARTPSAAAWGRARAIARAALSGTVFASVGNATHYHTDWVRPYWSSSLDKVTAVGTHLFFRWKGWWGTPTAFYKSSGFSSEPIIARIARLSSAHADGDAPLQSSETLLATGLPPLSSLPAEIRPVRSGQWFGSAEVVAVDSSDSSFIVALDRNTPPDGFQTQALNLCGGRPRCRVMGWTDPKRTPGGFPIIPSLLDAMAYSYMRDRVAGIERSLWDCGQYPRTSNFQCMRDREPVKLALDGRSG